MLIYYSYYSLHAIFHVGAALQIISLPILIVTIPRQLHIIISFVLS